MAQQLHFVVQNGVLELVCTYTPADQEPYQAALGNIHLDSCCVSRCGTQDKNSAQAIADLLSIPAHRLPQRKD